MANENQLEETSDSIQPIKNGLGVAPEIFTEFVREFDRACQSKNISKPEIIQFMNQRNSWRVRCVAMGAVSNVIIVSVPEPDEILSLLNNLGEDIVIDEVIRASLDYSIARTNEQKTTGKRSTNKIPAPKPNNATSKKDSSSINSPNIEYHNKSSNNKVVVLSVLGIVGILLALGGILLMHNSSEKEKANSKNNEPKEVKQNIETTQVEKIEPIKPIENKPKPEITKEIVEPPSISKSPFNGKMIVPDGTVIYQSGSEFYIGGEMVMLSSIRKKSTNSPFMVGNHSGTSYVFIKFDLRNIPADAIIESAHLRINLTVSGDGAEIFKMYCLPLPSDWSYQTVAYNRDGDMSETSYDSFLKRISSAEKISLNLRNDWVSFNVSNIVKDWVSKKSDNYGFVIFSDSNSSVVFEGFDSIRKLITPKLVLSFGKVKAPEQEKPIENKTNDVDAANNLLKEKSQPPKEKVVNAKEKEKKEDENIDGNLPLDPEKNNQNKKPNEPTKNIFEEDPELKTKENENNKTTKNQPPEHVKTEHKNDNKTEGKTDTKVDPLEVKVDYPIDVSMKEPIIWPTSRLIEVTESVKLDNPEGKGEIRYTIDGKDPSPDSTLYSEPFKVSGSLCIVKSAIFIERARKSNISVQEFRVAGGQGQLIDNVMSGCKKIGNWESSKSKPNLYGKDYSWEQKGKGTVEWVPSISKKSNCEVYVWLPDGDSSRSDKAKYTVKFDGGTKEVFVDQTKRNVRWVYLGTFPMKGGSGSLILQDDGSGKMFVADAAYFYFLNE